MLGFVDRERHGLAAVLNSALADKGEAICSYRWALEALRSRPFELRKADWFIASLSARASSSVATVPS